MTVNGPRYHSHVSPRSLSTLDGKDPIRNYPAHWELLRWYKCWRKYPYAAEGHAALIVKERVGDYSHYPCTYDSGHWHIGRGKNRANRSGLTQRAKHTYRRAVRHEIWQEHLQKGQESD